MWSGFNRDAVGKVLKRIKVVVVWLSSCRASQTETEACVLSSLNLPVMDLWWVKLSGLKEPHPVQWLYRCIASHFLLEKTWAVILKCGFLEAHNINIIFLTSHEFYGKINSVCSLNYFRFISKVGNFSASFTFLTGFLNIVWQTDYSKNTSLFIFWESTCAETVRYSCCSILLFIHLLFEILPVQRH